MEVAQVGCILDRTISSRPLNLLSAPFLCVTTHCFIMRFWVVSLSCCDALLSMLETGVRWYVVGQGTLRAPDTRVTPPSSRHDRSGPLPSLGSRVAIYAVSQLHESAPALVTARASPDAVAWEPLSFGGTGSV